MRQAKLGRGGRYEVTNLKLRVGTQGVAKLPRQSWPAAGTESCVVPGQPGLQSVDREQTGRVIEPRNTSMRKPTLSKKRKAAPESRDGLARRFHRGRRAGHVYMGVPQELGRSHSFR